MELSSEASKFGQSAATLRSPKRRGWTELQALRLPIYAQNGLRARLRPILRRGRLAIVRLCDTAGESYSLQLFRVGGFSEVRTSASLYHCRRSHQPRKARGSGLGQRRTRKPRYGAREVQPATVVPYYIAPAFRAMTGPPSPPGPRTAKTRPPPVSSSRPVRSCRRRLSQCGRRTWTSSAIASPRR